MGETPKEPVKPEVDEEWLPNPLPRPRDRPAPTAGSGACPVTTAPSSTGVTSLGLAGWVGRVIPACFQ